MFQRTSFAGASILIPEIVRRALFFRALLARARREIPDLIRLAFFFLAIDSHALASCKIPFFITHAV